MTSILGGRGSIRIGPEGGPADLVSSLLREPNDALSYLLSALCRGHPEQPSGIQAECSRQFPNSGWAWRTSAHFNQRDR
jgi:hypothetical protein